VTLRTIGAEYAVEVTTGVLPSVVYRAVAPAAQESVTETDVVYVPAAGLTVGEASVP